MKSSAFFVRVSKVLQFAGHRAFETSTEHGRSAERHRRIILAALASAAARATSIATALISIPLTLHYLGAERFGVWMTISAFTAMLAFADLGIGNGVLTAVSRASGREDLHAVRNYVSSAFALLGTIALAILLMLATLYPYVQWHEFFNVSGTVARSEAGPALAVFIACLALSLPLGIVQRVQMGMQMGFMAGLWQCFASIAGLVGVLFAVRMKLGLPWLVAALAGAPLLIAGLNSLVFFGRIRPDFSPRVQAASRTYAMELARLGILFFVLQLAAAITYFSDNFVIAQILGAEQVAHYATPDRLFAVASMLVGLAVTPLWPAFGESITRGDHAWARRTLIRASILSAAIAGGTCLTLLVAGPILIKLWVGPAIQASFMLLLGLAIWRTIEATAGAASMYLNALRAVRLQVAMAATTAAVAITFKILLVGRFGTWVMPWITIGAYLVFAGLPMCLFLRQILRKATGGNPAPPI